MNHFFSSLTVLLFSFVSACAMHNSASARPLAASAQAEDSRQQTRLKAQIDDILDEYFPSEDAPGTALMILKNGGVLYKRTIGKANLELGVDIRHDTLFRIGSNTKPFTAMAILRLAEEGKLSLQDDITKYFEDYPTSGHTITIEHLLSHTSGIKNFTSIEGFSKAQTNHYYGDDFIEFFKSEPMDFPPGTEYRYSNSGYFLLGRIISKVSGMPYSAYLHETFFKPLGMENTTYDNTRRVIKNRASGYVPDEGTYLNGKYVSMTIPYAAGSLLSTTKDMARWYQGVMKGEVVSPQSLQTALTPYRLNDGSSTCCGYASFLGNLLGSPIWGHTGGITGFYSTMVYLPEDDIFVVALTNNNWQNIDFENLSTKLAGLVIGKPYFQSSNPDLDIASYAGVYTSNQGKTITLLAEDHKLFYERSGGGKWVLFEAEPDTFYNEIDFTTFRFDKNDLGKITGLSSLRHGAPISYQRTTDSGLSAWSDSK